MQINCRSSSQTICTQELGPIIARLQHLCEKCNRCKCADPILHNLPYLTLPTPLKSKHANLYLATIIWFALNRPILDRIVIRGSMLILGSVVDSICANYIKHWRQLDFQGWAFFVRCQVIDDVDRLLTWSARAPRPLKQKRGYLYQAHGHLEFPSLCVTSSDFRDSIPVLISTTAVPRR